MSIISAINKKLIVPTILGVTGFVSSASNSYSQDVPPPQKNVNQSLDLVKLRNEIKAEAKEELRSEFNESNRNAHLATILSVTILLLLKEYFDRVKKTRDNKLFVQQINERLHAHEQGLLEQVRKIASNTIEQNPLLNMAESASNTVEAMQKSYHFLHLLVFMDNKYEKILGEKSMGFMGGIKDVNGLMEFLTDRDSSIAEEYKKLKSEHENLPALSSFSLKLNNEESNITEPQEQDELDNLDREITDRFAIVIPSEALQDSNVFLALLIREVFRVEILGKEDCPKLIPMQVSICTASIDAMEAISLAVRGLEQNASLADIQETGFFTEMNESTFYQLKEALLQGLNISSRRLNEIINEQKAELEKWEAVKTR